MSLDVLVLGATGVTGRRVARYLAQSVQSGHWKPTWAISGRSEERLDALRSELSFLGLPPPTETVLCDLSDTDSLSDAVRSVKGEGGGVVLNASGPYRFLGKDVVHACAREGRHYVDVTGESQFAEECFLAYDELARKNGVSVLHACGFDSAIADFGVLYTERLFPKGCLSGHDGPEQHLCSAVESFFTIHPGPQGAALNYTTLVSAVHGFADVRRLKQCRKEIREKDPEASIRAAKRIGPPLKRQKNLLWWDERMKQYAMPFLGSDASVVRSSQRTMAAQNPVPRSYPSFTCYAGLGKSPWLAYSIGAFAMLGLRLVQSKWGRKMLLQHPELLTMGFIPRDGPTEQQIDTSAFSVTFLGSGYSSAELAESGAAPDLRAITKVTGPELGYVTAPAIMCEVGRSIVDGIVPNIPTGVHTPGGAFHHDLDTIIDQLEHADIHYKVLAEAEPVVPAESMHSRL